MSNVSFQFMSFFFKFRDFFSSPMKILEQIGIQQGWYVLDYGCGPGSYSIRVAQLVGPAGYDNVHTILTDCNTKLPDASIDVALLFYVLHDYGYLNSNRS
jgi:ubiquinone/menaquinone biosynthesis C-methylase UbiE